MKQFIKDGITYAIHGQTPDLYEELYGDDSDIFNDAFIVMQENLALINSTKNISLDEKTKLLNLQNKINKEVELNPEDISLIKNISELTKSVRFSKLGRQIIICAMAQFKKDQNLSYYPSEFLKDVDVSIFCDQELLFEVINLICTKKK